MSSEVSFASEGIVRGFRRRPAADDRPAVRVDRRGHRRELRPAVSPERGEDGAMVLAQELAGFVEVHAAMMPRMNFIVAADIEQYAEEHTTPPAVHLRALAQETERT